MKRLFSYHCAPKPNPLEKGHSKTAEKGLKSSSRTYQKIEDKIFQSF